MPSHQFKLLLRLNFTLETGLIMFNCVFNKYISEYYFISIVLSLDVLSRPQQNYERISFLSKMKVTDNVVLTCLDSYEGT